MKHLDRIGSILAASAALVALIILFGFVHDVPPQWPLP